MYSCYLPCCKVSFLSNIIVVTQTFFRSVFFIFFTFNLLVSSYVRQISYRNIIYYLHVMQLLMWLGLHTLCCYLFSICPTYSLLFSPISPALKKCFFLYFIFSIIDLLATSLSFVSLSYHSLPWNKCTILAIYFKSLKTVYSIFSPQTNNVVITLVLYML